MIKDLVKEFHEALAERRPVKASVSGHELGLLPEGVRYPIIQEMRRLAEAWLILGRMGGKPVSIPLVAGILVDERLHPTTVESFLLAEGGLSCSLMVHDRKYLLSSGADYMFLGEKGYRLSRTRAPDGDTVIPGKISSW